MRDLSHPDMQKAIHELRDSARTFTREKWLIEESMYWIFLVDNREVAHFTRAERDLIIAHLTILGTF